MFASTLSSSFRMATNGKFAAYALVLLLAACGGGGGGGSDDTPAPQVPLDIVSQPIDQSVVDGKPATFSVTAVGEGNLSYQWRRNDVVVRGATGPSYTLAAATPQDHDSTFSVLVGDAKRTIASASARLTVSARPVAPSILVPPADQRAVDGTSVSFSVTAEGTAPLSYQWQRNGVPVPGATAATLTLKVTLADDGAKFRAVVSNRRGKAVSAEALLSVVPVPIAPVIVTQPAAASVVAPMQATFSAKVIGELPLRYQWRRNGIAIAGANADTYTTPATIPADNGSLFTLQVSNAVGQAVSLPAALTVTEAPKAPAVLTHPDSQSVTEGQVATFSVVASGTAPLTFQWRRNGSNIVGANASSYSTPATSVSDSGSVFTVMVANAAGSALSSSASLTVIAAAPVVTLQPVDRVVNSGQPASFSAAASGTPPLTYQWQRNGLPIAGANSDTYTTPATTPADSGSLYALIVSNAAGQATSRSALLTVNAVAPAITLQPVDQSVAQGQSASFSVAASGTAPLSYQWRRNGANIIGATASIYTTPATVASSDNGAGYDVVVSNAAGSTTSRLASLTVSAPPPPVSYLQGLVASIPPGGWVKASTNAFSDVWPTGTDLPPPTPGGPLQIIVAWSGFAWDSQRSRLMLFGGGHANYVGNEVYVWNGADGRWTRGSLPSRVDLSTALVMGNGAPQSAHTYQTSSYAPIVDRFVVFGGAGWLSGGPLFDANGPTGAWWWDPSKAHPDRVGGQDGTGWNPARAGSNAWQMRPDFPWVGATTGSFPTFSNGTSAYRQENGRDVIYLTMDMNASGWPNLYRYQIGSPTTPDLFEQVGRASGKSVMFQGTAAIDTRNGLFVRTAFASAGAPGDFAVWRLANNNAASPSSNPDFAVQLIDENGTAQDVSPLASIAYDPVSDQLILWDSLDRGTVWITRATFNPDGSINPVWVVKRAPSTTVDQPPVGHINGVLGKWKYAPELQAFVALSDANPQIGEVWLFKPPLR